MDLVVNRVHELQTELDVMPGVTLEKTDTHVFCRLREPREVLSSAIWGGGLSMADRFINLKVDANEVGHQLTPEQTLENYCHDMGWQGRFVGMMTAASMDSLRYKVITVEGVSLLVFLTTGLSNARRAGDAADSTVSYQLPSQAGTINIVVVSDRRFSGSAMAELLMMATEAKCAAMQQANVVSPVSGLTATGTGTDSVAVFNGPYLTDNGGQDEQVRYCGKHTQLGEVFAKALTALILDSVFYN